MNSSANEKGRATLNDGGAKMNADGGAGGGAQSGANAKPRGTLFRLLSYTRTAWLLIIALLGCIGVKSVLELAVPWVMGFMLFDGVIRTGDLSSLPFVLLILTGIFLAQKVFSFLQEYLNELTNQRIVHQLRCDLFEHIGRLPLGFFDRRRTGDLQSRITSDVDSADGILKTLVEDFASETIMLIGTIAFLWAVNWQLTLYVLPTVPALALSVFFFKRTIKRSARRIRDLLGDMSSHANEAISGVRVVKAFCGERFESSRFANTSRELLSARIRIAKLQSVYSSSVDVWVFVGTLIVIWVASPRIVEGGFTVGALVAYLSYLNKLYGPAKKLSKINVSVQKILAAGDRIFEVMDERAEFDALSEKKRGRASSVTPSLAGSNGKLRRASPSAARTTERGPHQPSRAELPDEQSLRAAALSVRFDSVTFSYDEERTALREFSLDVDAGETVALVGHSGGGKTTVVNLLLRFYQPTSGRIVIGDTPLERIPHEELRRRIGLVQQEIFLFTGTLKENIAYASPDATDEEIERAARAAHAHEFIEELPRGYQTIVGERGVNLSGGQRQRIAIARALLRDPSILIFDEATSHLDSESERLVQRALTNIARGRTVFIIAHRLSSIRRADKIVVIEQGGIVETGTHADLVSREGLYRKLFSLQSNSAGRTAPAME